MKSSTSRDAMNARVDEAFKKWPTFGDMPQTKKAGRRVAFQGDPDEQQNYVNALYAASTEGTPIGRDGAAIVVEPVAGDDDDMVFWASQVNKQRRLKAQPGQARQDGAALGSKSK